MASKIVRIDDKDLCSEWKEEDGLMVAGKILSYPELKKDLIDNGLIIIKAAHSSFGACFFLEVKGRYTGYLSVIGLEDDPINFDWNV